MEEKMKMQLIGWAEKYNDPVYFQEDPIIFPKYFAAASAAGGNAGQNPSEYRLADIEIAAVIASHLAWGRRSMIVRDCRRALDEMQWRPYEYVMNGEYRDENASLHRTVKWSEFAEICRRLKNIYLTYGSLERLNTSQIRTMVLGQKDDPKAPSKKINMMRRWMVRDDGKVDLGVWKHSDKKDLLIPLDVHVYEMAYSLGLTSRKQKDMRTVHEITEAFREIFPDDPCKGDFALFGYGLYRMDNED